MATLFDEYLPVAVAFYLINQFRQEVAVLEHTRFGLVVCDEGHRIKNANIKTSQVGGQVCACRQQ